MKSNGISQKKLAARLQVSQGLVWQWLNGETAVSTDMAKAIEKATGIPRMRLLYPGERAA